MRTTAEKNRLVVHRAEDQRDRHRHAGEPDHSAAPPGPGSQVPPAGIERADDEVRERQ